MLSDPEDPIGRKGSCTKGRAILVSRDQTQDRFALPATVTAALALLVIACVPASGSNSSNDLAPDVPTIVSLNPCIDAILLEVADPRQILAISHYSHDPSESSIPQVSSQRFESTGGTIEEIMALDPEIVVAGSFISPGRIEALSDLNIRTELYLSLIHI